jgi:hypothetical protein
VLDTLDVAVTHLQPHDLIPGRGIVAATTTHDGYLFARFTNGNEARYLPTQHLTVHRTT